jgi:hypothetical protein
MRALDWEETMRITICALSLVLCSTAFADSKKPAAAADKKAPSKEEIAKMMAEMEKAGAPGPEHKWLAESAGTWTAATKMWMDPTKPPMESVGSEEAKVVMGGRFVEMHYSGQMMGKPFEGMGIAGYDNTKKKFVMTWMDSMGTMILYVEGTGDQKQRVFTGEETMPNGMKRPFRWVMTYESPTKHKMEMFAPGMDGKEMKEMEIVYTKK